MLFEIKVTYMCDLVYEKGAYVSKISFPLFSNFTRLLQSIDQWRMREGGISPKSVLGPQMTKKTIFSCVRYLFIFIIIPPLPAPNIKIIYSA